MRFLTAEEVHLLADAHPDRYQALIPNLDEALAHSLDVIGAASPPIRRQMTSLGPRSDDAVHRKRPR